jgi:hypothetical protein
MAKLVEVDEIPADLKVKKYKLVPVDEAPEKPLGQQMNEAIGEIPRQVGLTTRYGIEGVGDTLNFLASPVRGVMNALGGNFQPANFSGIATSMGLPQPRDGRERAVAEASKLMAGSAVPIGISRQVSNLGGQTTQAVGKAMAANPLQQVVSAGGAGFAGGAVKESGGDPVSQFVASMVGGVGAPMAMNTGNKFMQTLSNLKSKPMPQNIDITINSALKDSGINFDELPKSVQNSIRSDVAKSLNTGSNVSPDALRRLADYKLIGATPTQGTLTLDPAIVTQQKNLAKQGINSKDLAAQQLAQVENQNNSVMINRLNELGASKGVDSENAGALISGYLSDVAETNKNQISALYNTAKDSSGRTASLDPRAFTNTLGNKLNEANLEAFLPAEIRTMVNNFAAGKTPLNINTSEQFKTIVGNAQRSTQDGNAKYALGLVRQSLDEAPLLGANAKTTFGNNQVALQGQTSNLGQEAIDAFNLARSTNRKFMQKVEQTPALKAVLDDPNPKGFFDKFVLRGNSKELENTLKVLEGNPEAIGSIKNQVLAHLKEKATGSAADEVGRISNVRFNSALKMLGENKLNLLFSPDEVAQLKALGRVASYEQFQPVGSAVNNSNSASAISGMIGRIADSPLLSKIPMGSMLAKPMQNISVGINSKTAMNVPNALSIPQFTQQQQKGLMLSPAIFGLLGQPNN